VEKHGIAVAVAKAAFHRSLPRPITHAVRQQEYTLTARPCLGKRSRPLKMVLWLSAKVYFLRLDRYAVAIAFEISLLCSRARADCSI
jgi:hypothetical protein